MFCEKTAEEEVSVGRGISEKSGKVFVNGMVSNINLYYFCVEISTNIYYNQGKWNESQNLLFVRPRI